MDPHGTNNLAHLPGAEGAADPYREPPVNYEAEQALLGAVLANNAAFEKLPAGTVETLLKPENQQKLATIITSHASPGTFAGDVLNSQSQIYLATGQYVNVEVKDGDTYVNGSKILGTVDATNGVVHVIDDVWVFE